MGRLLPFPSRGAPSSRREESQLTIRSAHQDGTFVIALYGELDLGVIEEFQSVLARAEASGASDVVLDLSALHFIDSTGIGLIMKAEKTFPANNQRLLMLRGPRAVHRAFEMCGVADRLPFVG